MACLAAPAPANSSASASVHLHRPPLVDKEYSTAKRQLILHEQLLLRSLHFDIAIEHPLKYLLNFCNLFKITSSVCQTAICAINDSLSLTQLCLTHHPSVVAAGALQFALEQVNAQDVAVTMPEKWSELIGITPISCEEVSSQMHNAISQTKSTT